MAVAFLLRLVFWIYTGTDLGRRPHYRAALGELLSRVRPSLISRLTTRARYHGFTSPISVLVPLLADRFHVGWGLPFQKLLSLLAGPVAVWFGYRVLRDYLAPFSRAAAVLGAGYLAVEHHQILWGMAGMETQLATAILLAVHVLSCWPGT